MPRHDYQLPDDWEAMTTDERDVWFIQERCRRQAMKQNTPFRHHVEEQIRRYRQKQRFKKTQFLGRRDNN